MTNMSEWGQLRLVRAFLPNPALSVKAAYFHTLVLRGRAGGAGGDGCSGSVEGVALSRPAGPDRVGVPPSLPAGPLRRGLRPAVPLSPGKALPPPDGRLRMSPGIRRPRLREE